MAEYRISFLLIIIGCFAEYLAAVAPPIVPPQDPTMLVEQLGADDSAKRQAAERQLERLGRSAEAALRESLKSSDAEIRRRGSRLLNRLDRPVLEQQLEALLQGQDSFTPPLPGWARFKDLVGRDRSARELYVDMYQADKGLLDLLQKDPAKAGAEIFDRFARLGQKAAAVTAPPTTLKGELAALLLVTALEGKIDGRNYYQTVSILLTPNVINYVEFDVGFRKLVTELLLRRGTETTLLPRTVALATQLGLNDFSSETLLPIVLKRLDAIITQPLDLNLLYQLSSCRFSLDLKSKISEKVKTAGRTIGRNFADDIARKLTASNEVYVVPTLLRNLGMEDVIDNEIKPALLRYLRNLEKQKVEVQAFYVIYSASQNLGGVEALELLEPVACRIIEELVADPNDSTKLSQAISFASFMNLNEALEALVKPAIRKQILAALENAEDLTRLARVCALAIQSQSDLIEGTLKSGVQKRAKDLSAGIPTFTEVEQMYQIARSLNDSVTINTEIRSALIKALSDPKLETQRDLDRLIQTLSLIRQLNVKEGIPYAIKVAFEKGGSAFARGSAIVCLGAIDTPDQANQLTPLLEDTTQVGRIMINGSMVQSQIRDVALAALIHSSGQKPTDYGFPQVADFNRNQFTAAPSLFAFPSDKERDEALAKWKKWKADQKK
jgi:hypothetical protein